jgi:CheY-like chemotaxis protein/anti-sigma regulatory factor (Ser/Thr protein kinase)
MAFSAQLPETVLVVDDDPATLDCMKETVLLLGLDVCVASDGEQALQVFDQQHPSLVITDVRMPNMDGLSLTHQIKTRRPDCPVIMVTGYGDESTAVAALKAGACDYLHKPFQISELKNTLQRSLSLIRAKSTETQALQSLRKLTWSFELENNLECLSGILTVMLRPVEVWLSEADQLHVRMGLQELLINAVEHGNLGISAEEKREALMEDTYDALFETRRQLPLYANRRVKVWMENDPIKHMFNCRIQDEGEGFDWEPLLHSQVDSIPAFAGSGRGIFLVKTLIPQIQYFGCGNEVMLTVQYGILESDIPNSQSSG